MTAILLALAPVFLVIVVGAVMRRNGFPGEGFWAPAERLTYYLLFPCLVVSTLAEADLAQLGTVLPMAAAILSAIALTTVALFAVRAPLAIDGPRFTSILQGAIRQNTYIGLAIAAAFHGVAGLTAAAVAVVVIVPTVNVISVIALARYGAGQPLSLAGTAKQLVQNPLILSSLGGLALNVTGIGVPIVLDDILTILGRAALAFGLLAVGGALDLTALRASGGVALSTCGIKLIAMPLLTLAGCLAFGATGVEAFVAVMFNGLPTATNSYILARQLGGDAKLMAGVTTLETALSALTLPAVLSLLLILPPS